jgi:plasmid maintenance system killer protein
VWEFNSTIPRGKIMIKSFKDKTLEKLFRQDKAATTKQEEKIKNRLESMAVASKIEKALLDLRGLMYNELQI